MLDEFASYRKEGLFVNSPRFGNTGTSLLLQLQAVIAEYERALIKERSRRGKRSKARAGIVTVLEAV